MDTSAKMEGSASVSQALGGVWEIQKKGRIDDQHKGKRKKEDKGEERFEDGLVPREEITAAAETEVTKEKDDAESVEAVTTRKIDIVI